MIIVRKLSIINFRSHESFVLNLSRRVTRVTGRNGCGKTSLLEAIYEAMQGKSFRAVDAEMVRRGAGFYRIELEYEDGRKVVVVYDGIKKEFLAEDKRTKRLAKKAKYPIVLFEPDDLHLVGSSPASRRTYFDRVFAQLSEAYATALSRYNKALKQRNELLKGENVTVENVFSWDVLLAKYGVEIVRTRKKYVQEINKRFTDVYHSIAENGDVVELGYETDVRTESDVLERLAKEFPRDAAMGHTGFGVHRDNYEFVFNQVKADGSASRGEVRSSVLALKFIEAELAEKVLGKRPLVLLDDVFSELDSVRQKSLVKNFEENQVILTSVGDSELVVE